jgi:hypothetical protein
MNGNEGLSAADVALLNRNNNWSDNSFMWIFALLILANGGNGWFGNNGNNYHPQYATQDFVQNGFNFNDLQDQNRDILTAITNGTAQSVAAVNQAKYDNINVAKDIESMILNQIGEVKVGQASLLAKENECCGMALRAIDGVNYNNALNTASINANTTAQVQKVLDVISGNRMADMQNQINALQIQNAMAGVVRYPMAWTYNAGQSPFCNCPCGTGM